MRATAVTDIGKTRAVNQDYVYTSVDRVGCLPNLFIVADGMGGHQAGDYASRYAIETFLDYIRHTESSNLIRVMDEGIAEANRKVLEKSFENEELAGMGTTMVAAVAQDGKLYVANVGDSRLYVISDMVRQITRDHSLVDEMVRLGELNPSEARSHPDKNIITRAIGAQKNVKADFFEVELAEDDYVLMCTDGLTNMVRDEEILDIVRSEKEPEAIAHKLVRMANDNGGRDNITVTIIKPF